MMRKNEGGRQEWGVALEDWSGDGDESGLTAWTSYDLIRCPFMARARLPVSRLENGGAVCGLKIGLRKDNDGS